MSASVPLPVTDPRRAPPLRGTAEMLVSSFSISSASRRGPDDTVNSYTVRLPHRVPNVRALSIIHAELPTSRQSISSGSGLFYEKPIVLSTRNTVTVTIPSTAETATFVVPATLVPLDCVGGPPSALLVTSDAATHGLGGTSALSWPYAPSVVATTLTTRSPATFGGLLPDNRLTVPVAVPAGTSLYVPPLLASELISVLNTAFRAVIPNAYLTFSRDTTSGNAVLRISQSAPSQVTVAFSTELAAALLNPRATGPMTVSLTPAFIPSFSAPPRAEGITFRASTLSESLLLGATAARTGYSLSTATTVLSYVDGAGISGSVTLLQGTYSPGRLCSELTRLIQASQTAGGAAGAPLITFSVSAVTGLVTISSAAAFRIVFSVADSAASLGFVRTILDGSASYVSDGGPLVNLTVPFERLTTAYDPTLKQALITVSGAAPVYVDGGVTAGVAATVSQKPSGGAAVAAAHSFVPGDVVLVRNVVTGDEYDDVISAATATTITLTATTSGVDSVGVRLLSTAPPRVQWNAGSSQPYGLPRHYGLPYSLVLPPHVGTAYLPYVMAVGVSTTVAVRVTLEDGIGHLTSSAEVMADSPSGETCSAVAILMTGSADSNAIVTQPVFRAGLRIAQLEDLKFEFIDAGTGLPVDFGGVDHRLTLAVEWVASIQ